MAAPTMRSQPLPGDGDEAARWMSSLSISDAFMRRSRFAGNERAAAVAGGGNPIIAGARHCARSNLRAEVAIMIFRTAGILHAHVCAFRCAS